MQLSFREQETRFTLPDKSPNMPLALKILQTNTLHIETSEIYGSSYFVVGY